MLKATLSAIDLGTSSGGPEALEFASCATMTGAIANTKTLTATKRATAENFMPSSRRRSQSHPRKKLKQSSETSSQCPPERREAPAERSQGTLCFANNFGSIISCGIPRVPYSLCQPGECPIFVRPVRKGGIPRPSLPYTNLKAWQNHLLKVRHGHSKVVPSHS